MKKTEFVSAITEEYGILRVDATKLTEIVFDQIRKQLLNGREVRIDGVGRFSFKFHKAKMRNNNLTGESHMVGPKVRLKFRPFPSMRRDLNRTLVQE